MGHLILPSTYLLRCFQACLNSIYAAVKHVGSKVFFMGNMHGYYVSKVSANMALDRLTEGVNSTVLRWKEETEAVMALPTQRLRRSKAHKDSPGFTFLEDNVGLVMLQCSAVPCTEHCALWCVL